MDTHLWQQLVNMSQVTQVIDMLLQSVKEMVYSFGTFSRNFFGFYLMPWNYLLQSFRAWAAIRHFNPRNTLLLERKIAGKLLYLQANL